MNEIKTFSNDMFSVLIKQDNENNLFDLETVAKSLGLSQIKNGKEYVKWERVNKYLAKYLSPQVEKTTKRFGRGDFIPEPMVYKLAFKAGNSTAESFQDWLALEVLPQLRSTGTYSVNPTIQELANNPELVKMLVEQIARLNDSTNNQSEDLAYLKQAVTGEYVTPQDILAIKYAITDKAEKFVEGLGVQLSLDEVLAGDIYELARENKRQEQQKNYHIGKPKSRLLVLTKKHLGMKGNAPNNHIKRKDVDLAIQFIKDIRLSAIEI